MPCSWTELTVSRRCAGRARQQAAVGQRDVVAVVEQLGDSRVPDAAMMAPGARVVRQRAAEQHVDLLQARGRCRTPACPPRSSARPAAARPRRARRRAPGRRQRRRRRNARARRWSAIRSAAGRRAAAAAPATSTASAIAGDQQHGRAGDSCAAARRSGWRPTCTGRSATSLQHSTPITGRRRRLMRSHRRATSTSRSAEPGAASSRSASGCTTTLSGGDVRQQPDIAADRRARADRDPAEDRRAGIDHDVVLDDRMAREAGRARHARATPSGLRAPSVTCW